MKTLLRRFAQAGGALLGVLIVSGIIWWTVVLPRYADDLRERLAEANPQFGVFAQPAKPGSTPQLMAAMIREGAERRFARPVEYERGEVVNKNSPSNRVPQALVEAITTIEDPAFFEHIGINVRGIARAGWHYLVRQKDEPLQGGSSITQQLMKVVMTDGRRTWSRKIADFHYAIVLEQMMAKNEIMTWYLNTAPLGKKNFRGQSMQIVGVGQAAFAYYGKDVRDLTLGQMASLAGALHKPAGESPLKEYEADALARRNVVLQKMLEQGKITQKEFTLIPAHLELPNPKSQIALDGGLYAVDFVQKKVKETYGLTDDQVSHAYIESTFRLDLQRAAENAYRSGLASIRARLGRIKKNRTLGAALVAANPKTGEIVAMVGGQSFTTTQLNRVFAKRQPGSAFKSVVYAAAVERLKLNPRDEFDDLEPTHGPRNYANYYRGNIPLREAVKYSSNQIAREVGRRAGLQEVRRLATKSGLSEPLVDDGAFLGMNSASAAEMLQFYIALFNGGVAVDLNCFTKLKLADGQGAEIPKPKRTPLVSPETAFLMLSMLEEPFKEGGTANSLFNLQFQRGNRVRKLDARLAGKTGSSSDGWFIGGTPELVCAVYVGYDEGSVDLGLTGSQSAGIIWADFMSRSLELHPELQGSWPEAPIKLTYATYARTSRGEEYRDYFWQGKEPKEIKFILLPEPTPTPSPTLEPSPTPTATPIPEILKELIEELPEIINPISSPTPGRPRVTISPTPTPKPEEGLE